MKQHDFTLNMTDMPRRARKRNKNNIAKLAFNAFPPHRTNPILAMGESSDKFVYSYSCAMLNLNNDIADTVCNWAKEHIPTDVLYINEDAGMDGYEDTPHVTIKYGLHDVEPTKLKKLVNGYGPIKFKLGLVEKFDTNPDFDVLKIAIHGTSLIKLNELISNNMDHSDKFDEYKPHVTLAYVTKNSCDDLISNNFFDKLEDKVYEIYFTSKTGDDHFIDL